MFSLHLWPQQLQVHVFNAVQYMETHFAKYTQKSCPETCANNPLINDHYNAWLTISKCWNLVCVFHARYVAPNKELISTA